MTTNVVEFSKELAEFAAKIPGLALQLQRKVTLLAADRLILASPVGNPTLWKSKAPPGYVGGRFRGNWQVAQDVPASGVIEQPDPSGAVAQARNGAAIAALAPFSVSVIVNNAPYGDALNAGHSTQAPAGWVDQIAAGMQAEVQRIADAIEAQE